ncbi:MAG: polyprenyl synthetase family protein [Anaerolineae bacterium]|jgi:geranylgeranyl diphosphate synthase type I
MGDLDKALETYLPALEEEMRAALQPRGPSQVELFGMLGYHMGWVDSSFDACEARSGKRVRPTLCLLACDGCHGAWERALPAAAALELLHNFTLIHDDIEDRDRTRRNRPTVWSLWGEPQAINAGDTLLALAQLALLGLQEKGISPEIVLQATRLFNATCVTLTVGQYLDISFESRSEVSVADYLEMIEAKTGALVACSCEMGALIAGAQDAQRECLRAFGRHLGLAFQMQDDILGIWGDSDATGKPVGADIARRKKTLPLLHGLESSPALRLLTDRDTLSAGDVRQATELLAIVGSRDFTKLLARQHHGKALDALQRAELQPHATRALRELSSELVSRDR